ncbi:hypothetical protein [Salinibius halmophilus]|uniref:hypothetical protein n=1 Tax=Salinibius halmophilus TaxID=1853216 RepID=UPI000E66732D|nr:hypothetical protein [Salinibius halmophilus]
MVVHLLGNPQRLATLLRVKSELDIIICLDAGISCDIDAYYEQEACAQYGLNRAQQLSMDDIALQCANAEKVISWY